MKKKLITIGVPAYNEELNVETTYRELKKQADKNKKYRFEFIFVDNGSEDATRQVIKSLAKKDKDVKGIFLSRNFGPEASGQAALETSKGDAFIFFECDLQDPPELITTFIKKWEKGSDIVIGTRTKIDDTFFMILTRKTFYAIFKLIANISVPVNSGAFGLIDRRVLDSLRSMPEKYRFYRGLRAWVGFKTAYVPYKRRKRMRGKSSYSFLGYIKHAERSVFGFSYLPLDFIIYLGLLVVIFSFAFILFFMYQWIFNSQPINSQITTFFLIFFFGGIQLLAISIIGKYIQVIVEETKNRPTYIIESSVNL